MLQKMFLSEARDLGLYMNLVTNCTKTRDNGAFITRADALDFKPLIREVL